MRGPVQIGSLLLVTTFLCLPYPCLCDWVNPYLAGYPSAEDNQKLSVYDGQERGKCVQSSTCQHYMTRFVNLFIRSTGLQGRVVKQPDDIRHVTLQLQLTGWQLRVLQEFGEDESAANDATFESVDRALTEILMQQSTTSEGRWTGGIFADVEWSNILNRVTPLGNIVFFIGSLLVVLSWNLYCSHSLMRTVAYLFLIILLALFGYGCYEKHLIKIAKVKAAQMKYEGSIPVECTPSRMRFWNMFVNNLRNDDVCEKYFIDVEVPILSLADVGGSFRDAVRLIFFETLGGVGSMLSMTIQSLADKFPWPLNYIVFPIFLVFILIFGLCTLAICRCDVKIWHPMMGSFKMSAPKQFSGTKLESSLRDLLARRRGSSGSGLTEREHTSGGKTGREVSTCTVCGGDSNTKTTVPSQTTPGSSAVRRTTARREGGATSSSLGLQPLQRPRTMSM